jgi:hypothetical protein
MSLEAGRPDHQSATERVQAIKRAYAAQLLAKRNVVGVGVGFCEKGGVRTGQVGLVVMVSKKVPAAQLTPADLVPSQIEGVPVDVQAVGELRAL